MGGPARRSKPAAFTNYALPPTPTRRMASFFAGAPRVDWAVGLRPPTRLIVTCPSYPTTLAASRRRTPRAAQACTPTPIPSKPHDGRTSPSKRWASGPMQFDWNRDWSFGCRLLAWAPGMYCLSLSFSLSLSLAPSASSCLAKPPASFISFSPCQSACLYLHM